MYFCKKMNTYCVVIQDKINTDTFFNKNTISGLKDTSNPLCPFKGKEECLYKEN